MSLARAARALVVALAIALAIAGCNPPRARVAPTAPPTPTPAPTIDPDADEAQAAMAAFAALTARRGLSFHLEQANTIVQRGQIADSRYVLDVSGRDLRAAISAAGTTIDLVVVDNAAWARERGRPWQRGKAADDAAIEQLIDPWQYLGPLDQLAFVGRVDGSPTRYRYRSTAPIPYRTPVLDRMGIPGSIDTLDLVLEADGTPVEYTFQASARPTSGGMADLGLEMTSRVELTRIGERITIKRPR